MGTFQQGQAGIGGLNATVEFEDRVGTYSIPAGQKLLQGQVLFRDVTQLSGFASTKAGGAPAANVPVSGGQSDMLVLPTSANAGDPYGVYQDQTIDNSAGAAALVVVVRCRKRGVGVVNAGAAVGGAAVNVGSALTAAAAQAYAVAGVARAFGNTIGRALATVVAGVLVSAAAAALIAVPGAGNTQLLIQADIDVH